MKAPKMILGLLTLITLTASAAYGQQTYTQTVTAQNKGCNTGCTLIDAPGLNNNPAALIFATPVPVSGVTQYPFTIGALYRTYEQKWSIFNLNGAAMAVGAKFNLEYYAGPDANHFVYIVPPRVHSYDDATIDHAGLNNNPNAQIRVFATNPTAGNSIFNSAEVGVAYVASTSKWIIANNLGGDVPSGTAYNVMFSGGAVASGPLTPLPASSPTAIFVPLPTPTSGPAAPSGSAGGDLSGTYPNPKVIGLQGRPISSTAPAVGQTLRWNGTLWTPLTDPVSTGQTPTSLPPNGNAGGDLGGTYPNPTVQKLKGRALSNTAPTVGQVLKWNGTTWEPAADNAGSSTPTTTAPIQTFFKTGNQATPDITNLDFPMIELGHTIVVTKRSRLVISATVLITAEVPFGVIPTQGTQGILFLWLNGPSTQTAVVASAGAGLTTTATICNYMVDAQPGTYTVEFKVANDFHNGSAKTKAVARYSSVMVIPL